MEYWHTGAFISENWASGVLFSRKGPCRLDSMAPPQQAKGRPEPQIWVPRAPEVQPRTPWQLPRVKSAQALGRPPPEVSSPVLVRVPDHVRHGKSGVPRQVPAPTPSPVALLSPPAWGEAAPHASAQAPSLPQSLGTLHEKFSVQRSNISLIKMGPIRIQTRDWLSCRSRLAIGGNPLGPHIGFS